MDNVLVLGLIPGTNIAISFQVWIALGMALLTVTPARRIYVHRQLAIIRSAMRQPMHASQLHRRLNLTAR